MPMPCAHESNRNWILKGKTRVNNLDSTCSMDQKLQAVCRSFRIPGTYQSYEEIKVGNVNKTYKVNFVMDDDKCPGKKKEKSFMVQAINTYAFKEPVKVMDNIALCKYYAT